MAALHSQNAVGCIPVKWELCVAGVAGAVPCSGHRLCVTWDLSHLLLSQARLVCAHSCVPALA